MVSLRTQSNSKLWSLEIIGLADTFYKKNILTIENRNFDDLNSTIFELSILKAENINIDSNLLNPSVFKYLEMITLTGPVNMIDGKSLNAFKNLMQIIFLKEHFRDMIHKNGIKWKNNLNTNIKNIFELKNKNSKILKTEVYFFNI